MTGLLSKRTNHIALEIIDFQNNTFGQQIERIVADIREPAISNGNFGDNIQKLEQLIFSRLGIKVQLEVDKDIAAILPMFFNKNSVLLNQFYRGDFSIKDQDAVIKKAHNKKGFVDLKNAKVSGIFSEYKNLLYINFKLLYTTYDCTAADITSFILHELGHAFYVLEYADRLETTNQVLANIAIEVTSKKKEKNMEYIYKELRAINDNVTEAEVDAMINGQKTVASYMWLKTVMGSVSSQLSHGHNDQSAFEQMADNFVSRFGYGKQLIISMDKLHDYFGNPEKSRSANAFGFIISTVVLLIITFGLIVFITGGVAFFASIFAHWLTMAFGLSGERFRDHTYDDLKIRYKRIRNEQIALLKNRSLSKEDINTVLEAVYLMDNTINATYEYRGIFDKVANIIFSENRMIRNSMKEQQLLEELATNDLFLMSAKFKAAE